MSTTEKQNQNKPKVKNEHIPKDWGIRVRGLGPLEMPPRAPSLRTKSKPRPSLKRYFVQALRALWSLVKALACLFFGESEVDQLLREEKEKYLKDYHRFL